MARTFGNLITPSDLQNAINTYSNTPFEKLLRDARMKDKNAINYIYYVTSNVISSAFYKYFPRNMAMEYAPVVASSVYMSFLDTESNPLLSFNVAKFPNLTGNAEKINKLRYYVYLYAKNSARSIYNSEVRDEKDNVSYDSTLTPTSNFSREETIGQEDSHQKELENNLIFSNFVKDLNPTQRKIMILRYHGLSIADIGKKLSLSRQRVDQILKKIKPQYTKYLQIQGVI